VTDLSQTIMVHTMIFASCQFTCHPAIQANTPCLDPSQ